YAIAPAYWKQGLITESAKAVLQYGFESLDVERIVASADVPNVGSIRVLEKIGMQFDKQELVDGLELIFYSIAQKGFVSEETP
ncbi:MAG: GNAT family N-acetyltransferase, partial [Lysobacterales bacterium]